MSPKTLTDLEWVKLAAANDANKPYSSSRPVLGGVHINGEMVATDGHRLHLAATTGGLQPGLWDARTFAPIEGNYPNYRMVMPTDTPNYSVDNLQGMIAILEAAIAANKSVGVNLSRTAPTYITTLPLEDGSFAAVNPVYLLDILKGAIQGTGVRAAVALSVTDPLKPIRIVIASEGKREAVLMTFRRANGSEMPDPRFDLSEFVSQV